MRSGPGISVKLSALHPRYEWSHRDDVMAVLLPRARDLARAAARARIGFNIDAEEADRLDLSLDVIEALLADRQLAGWDGFGVVVQAYGRRAGAVIDHLDGLARSHRRRIMVRLVKGAYWDSEIKWAQEKGLPDFPVFTRKPSTDVSYLANARKLLDARERIYPQFATHNAHTVAAVLAMAGDREGFEFQRLHGMGEALHEAIREAEGTRCRLYAPVGRAPRPARLPGAAAAGERRQLVLRQPDRRQGPRPAGPSPPTRSPRSRPSTRSRTRRSAARPSCSRRGGTRPAGTSTSRPRSAPLIAARAPPGTATTGTPAATGPARPVDEPRRPLRHGRDRRPRRRPRRSPPRSPRRRAGFADWSARPAAERARVLRPPPTSTSATSPS